MKYYSIFNPENIRKRRNMRKAQIILFRTRIEFLLLEHGLHGLNGYSFILMTIFFKIALFENKG